MKGNEDGKMERLLILEAELVEEKEDDKLAEKADEHADVKGLRKDYIVKVFGKKRTKI